MNLTDLTEAAQCKDCLGNFDDWTTGPLGTGIRFTKEDPCPRCHDHPGIDPDNMHQGGLLIPQGQRAVVIVVAVDPA